MKKLPDKPTPPSNTQYIVAVVAMMLIAVAGVVVIVVLRPEADVALVIAAVFGFLAPTTLSMLSFMKAQETHLSVNSRLDQFIRNAEMAARAEGIGEGEKKANERTDALRKRE